MRTEHGTTLLEMLVVLGMLGMLSALGVSLLAGRTEREADRAAARVAEQLRAVRREAMTRGAALAIEVGDEARVGLSTQAGSAHERRHIAAPGKGFVLRGVPGAELIFFADGSARGGAVEVLHDQVVRRIETDWPGTIHVLAAR